MNGCCRGFNVKQLVGNEVTSDFSLIKDDNSPNLPLPKEKHMYVP